jgi:hypothetical protein
MGLSNGCFQPVAIRKAMRALLAHLRDLKSRVAW